MPGLPTADLGEDLWILTIGYCWMLIGNWVKLLNKFCIQCHGQEYNSTRSKSSCFVQVWDLGAYHVLHG